MSRYFITTNAALNYTAGGRNFPFEPVAQRGGSWLGVLALDTPSDADILLNGGFPQVAEISNEYYDSLKKKPEANQNSLPVSPTRQQPVGLAVAPVVGRSSGHGAGPVDLSTDPNSTANFSSVSLLSGDVTPPHEPMLEQQPSRNPRPKPR